MRPGPVINTFELEPAPGVKVNRIVTLADDLSMALRAMSVRILAPIPGKSVVGIELSNPRREKVFLREILESDEFQNASTSKLTLALGKDSVGKPVVADLARMPHLLVAGATGTGKSVSLNAMIMSILYKATPDDVRFLMIDPKMLELSLYENIPHLLTRVVTDPREASAVLNRAVIEMDDRYRLLRDKGVRNIESYNRVLESESEEKSAGVIELKDAEPNEPIEGLREGENGPVAEKLVHRRLPYLVIVIDELADLMLTSGREVEEQITRLAQKARAAGIHLILATQRPSVDVITGLIKANVPARISFQVTSRIDSRTILDSIGAERLLGDGDMLFMPPSSARLTRIHGALVSEPEIRKVVGYLKDQSRPVFDQEFTRAIDEAHEEKGGRPRRRESRRRHVRSSGRAGRREPAGVDLLAATQAPRRLQSGGTYDRTDGEGRPDQPRRRRASTGSAHATQRDFVRRRVSIAVAALVWLVAGVDGAGAKSTPSPPKVAEVVRKLQARYEATKDFTADFSQTVEAATLGKPLQSTGQVFFKRPGRMRWEFAEPEKQTIVADGKLLWVYQPEHHQVLKTPFRAAFQSATPISFLLGVGQLKDDFDATLLRAIRQTPSGSSWCRSTSTRSACSSSTSAHRRTTSSPRK